MTTPTEPRSVSEKADTITIDEVMEQAQVFASAYALVGGRFDGGSKLRLSQDEKDNLEVMIRMLVDGTLQDERDGGWQDMSCAPRDGTIINAVGRYPEATAGFPRYVGYRDGKWVEFSRFEPQEIICWAWRPRGSWPSEPHTSKDSGV